MTQPSRNLWRRSAAILLMRPGNADQNQVLMIKRSDRSSFMPNFHVFPGGLCDQSDFSQLWLKAFPALKNYRTTQGAVYPDLFRQTDRQTTMQRVSCDTLSLHVAYRLTAIRELFEETGLLLASPEETVPCLDSPISVGNIADGVEPSWRKRVRDSASEFLVMCRDLSLVPNIWSLHDWSTWLTPIGLSSDRRYETQFYAAFLKTSQAIPSADDAEVASVKFWDMDELLTTSNGQLVPTPPPQFYELKRLQHFSNIQQLSDYALKRGKKGTERWFPVFIKCSNGQISALPGDSLYPEVPDVYGAHPMLTTRLSVEQCMRLFPVHNRLIMQKNKPIEASVNCQSHLGQISPMITYRADGPRQCH